MTFDKAAFYAELRKSKPQGLGPLNAGQVKGIETLLDACEGAPLAHASYMMATAWHETNGTMEPVVEAYWLSEQWRKTHLRYYPWHGRGYVQLTWLANYKKADKKLGLNGALIATPDLALDPVIAAKIMRAGMDEGWFTGVSLHKVLPIAGVATRAQYCDARTIINGRDKADLVEDYAQIFERGFRHGGWQ